MNLSSWPPMGASQAVHRSEVSSRYVYKHEMELLLRVAGFARWEIYGDFDRRPLTHEERGDDRGSLERVNRRQSGC